MKPRAASCAKHTRTSSSSETPSRISGEARPVDEPHRDILQKSPETWNLCTAGMRAVNLGFGYDRVENALWRLRHGELDGAKDNAVCVVLLGTNNLAENTDGEILEGIRAVCREITGKLAKAVIILQGFYPRNSAREGTAERIAGINLLLNRGCRRKFHLYGRDCIMANSDGYVRKSFPATDCTLLRPVTHASPPCWPRHQTGGRTGKMTPARNRTHLPVFFFIEPSAEPQP